MSICLNKTSWEKYHEPFKHNHKEMNIVDKEICVNTVKSVEPKHYVEKPPFPSRIEEHSIVTTVKNKILNKCCTPYEQIYTTPSGSR